MPKVQVNDIELHFEEEGSGPPLLLIMGWGGNAATWKPQIPGLAERYHVITFDNRGVGRSSAPRRPYTIAQLAGDAAALLDALDVPRAHVFGISMGGMIAQELALGHPERVDGLVLGCTSPGSDNAAGIEELRQDIASLRASMKEGRGDLEWFTEFIRRLWTDDAIRRAEPFLQDFIFALIRYPPKPHGLLNQARAVARHNTYDRLHLIEHPTLVMTGDQDELIHPGNASILAEGIPGAELRIFEGLKHAFHLERPDEVNEEIIDFLDRASPKRRAKGRPPLRLVR